MRRGRPPPGQHFATAQQRAHGNGAGHPLAADFGIDAAEERPAPLSNPLQHLQPFLQRPLRQRRPEDQSLVLAVLQTQQAAPVPQSQGGVIVPAPRRPVAPQRSHHPPYPPEADGVEGQNDQVPLRRQHPFGLAQNAVGIMLEFELVHDDHGINAVAAKRQILVPRPDAGPDGSVPLHQPLADGTGHRQLAIVAETAELHQKTRPTVGKQAPDDIPFFLGDNAPEWCSEPGL